MVYSIYILYMQLTAYIAKWIRLAHRFEKIVTEIVAHSHALYRLIIFIDVLETVTSVSSAEESVIELVDPS